MLNRYEEAPSARTIVTNLSPEGLVSAGFWLRGHATANTDGLVHRRSVSRPSSVHFGSGDGQLREGDEMGFRKRLASFLIQLSIGLDAALEHLAVRIDSGVETRQHLDDIRQHMDYLAEMDCLRDVPDDLSWLDGAPSSSSAHTG